MSESTRYLPTNFRTYTGENNLYSAEEATFIRCLPLFDRYVVYNNLKCSEWAKCKVSGVHETFLSGGIGYRVVEALKDKIINGKIKITQEGFDKENKGEQLKTLQKIFSNLYLKKLFRQTLSKGSVLGVINIRKEKPYLSLFPIGKFIVEMDDEGKVIRSETFLDVFISSKGTVDTAFYSLVEIRLFDKLNKPKSTFAIKKTSYRKDTTFYDEKDGNNKSDFLEPKDIPENILKHFGMEKDNINKLIDIPLDDSLGLYLFNNTEENTKYPTVAMGESQLMPALDELYAYDHAFTVKENDKYLGRGRVLVPEIMRNRSSKMPKINNPSFNGSVAENVDDDIPYEAELDQTFFVKVNSYDIEKQKPTPVQFDMRTPSHWEELTNTASTIAVMCGIAPGDIDPKFAMGVQKTDDQVDAEKDITTSTVEAKRDLVIDSLNDMLNDVVSILKYEEKYSISFALSGMTNTSKRIKNTIELFSAGLISKKRAIQQIHPDWSEAEVEEELKLLEGKTPMEIANIFNDLGKLNDQQNDTADDEEESANGGA